MKVDLLLAGGVRTRSWAIESTTTAGVTKNHIILPCPKCDRQNRLTQGAIGAKCGSCGASISDIVVN